MHAPRLENKINWNTPLLIFTILGNGFGLGVGYQVLKSADLAFERDIAQLEETIDRVPTIEREGDRREQRLAIVERQIIDGAAAQRSIESSINSLASDMRLTREILQRLENRTSTDGQR